MSPLSKRNDEKNYKVEITCVNLGARAAVSLVTEDERGTGGLGRTPHAAWESREGWDRPEGTERLESSRIESKNGYWIWQLKCHHLPLRAMAKAKVGLE